MIFRQITHDDLGCASYLIGDEKAGTAAVVDPRFDVDEYLTQARYLGVRIEHILETHNHADHLSGHGRLAAATGASIHINRLAAPDYDHEPFDDGWELNLGTLVVRAIHTPGHRPEHTAFGLIDTARGDSVWAVLTGDSLFVGDVARPDLAVEKREGARGIYRSLEKLLTLPDECEVWPGHLGGSLCGGPGMDMKVSSTIAYERDHNEMLTNPDEEEFIETAVSTLGPQPPNFKAIVALNRGPLVTESSHLPLLSPRQVEIKRSEGALLVDVRTENQFDDAHVPGAVCNPSIRAGFGTKLAWVADRDREVVLIGRDTEDARRSSGLAASVGIRNLAGCLAGGMTSWREEKRPIESVERISIETLHERIDELQMLDVRDSSEWETVRIPGSLNVPYYALEGIPDPIDANRPIAVFCTSGQRAGLAASLLLRFGANEVIRVADGGIETWENLGWPVERDMPDDQRSGDDHLEMAEKQG